jgi:hypothetical protein
MRDKSLSELQQWQQHTLLAQGLKNMGTKLTEHQTVMASQISVAHTVFLCLFENTQFSTYFVTKQFPHHYQ